MLTPFSRLALILKALLLLVAFAVNGSALANSRPELQPIPTQTVFAGQAFVYRLTASDADGTIPGIRMINAPSDATIEDNGDGSRTFRWRPPLNIPVETVVLFQAFDANDSNLISTQRMVLRRSEVGAVNDSSANTGNESVSESSNATATVNSTVNRPPELPSIGVQNLTVNQDYQLFIKPIDADGTVAGLSAISLPLGAVLEDAHDGSRVFRWRPSAGQEGEHRTTFLATDAEDNALTSERVIVFAVSPDGTAIVSTPNTALPSNESNAGSSSGNPATDRSDSTQNANNEPYFEPISAPVVSAGQDISFRVVPRMPDQSASILHVDRLPRNASFADNFDGTRTFFWRTTEADQGEHVFRFTAIHHENVNQRVSTEVLIIIGNPGAASSLPQEPRGNNTAPILLPIEQKRVVVNNDLRFRVVATDNDGTVPALYLENVPDNVRFEDNGDGSRELFWTPDITQSGTHQFNIVATDFLDSTLVTRLQVTVTVIDTNSNSAALPPPPQNLNVTSRPNSKAEAAIFLQRATFGPDASSVSKLMQQTYADWINDQMSVGQTRYRDGVDAVLREYGLINITDGRRQFDRQQIRSDVFWNIAVNAPDQLRQRVAFALGQILVVSDKDAGLDNRVRGIANYHDILASEAFGNYRTLLSKVTLNPMMGDFLSMRRNEKPDIENNIQSDENYARELMQLFTLGLAQLQSNGQPIIGANAQPVPTYTQDDVVNLARVFTGWNYGDAGSMRTSQRSAESEIIPMKSFEEFHDKTQKRIVGNTEVPAGMSAAAELEFALDAIFNHPNVPPFVSKLLIQRLVTSNPSANYVQRVAAVFANNGEGVRGDLSAVIPAILLDDEALNGSAQGQWASGKLKEPVVKIASIWRAFAAKGAFGKLRYSGINADSLQNPYSAPSVFNFYSASYKPPGSIGNEGKFAPEAQILNDTTILRAADRLFDYAHAVPLGTANNSNQHAILLNLDEEKALANDVPALVNHLNDKLLSGNLSESLRAILLELGESTPTTDNGEQRVRELLYVLFISPEFSVQR